MLLLCRAGGAGLCGGVKCCKFDDVPVRGGLWRRLRGVPGRDRRRRAGVVRQVELDDLIAGGILRGLAAPEQADVAYYREVGRAFATFCCIMGHVFPAPFGFRGGKGILCGMACVFVMEYHAGIICMLIFAVAVAATRYVSLGSVLGALSVPVTALAQGFSSLRMLRVCFSVALVVLKHYQNIIRLIQHRESKIDFRPDVSHKLDSEDF